MSRIGFVSPCWPGLENILSELKTVLPNACLCRGLGRQADFVFESYVDPTEPFRDEGRFGDHTTMSDEIRRKIDSLFSGSH